MGRETYSANTNLVGGGVWAGSAKRNTANRLIQESKLVNIFFHRTTIFYIANHTLGQNREKWLTKYPQDMSGLAVI